MVWAGDHQQVMTSLYSSSLQQLRACPCSFIFVRGSGNLQLHRDHHDVWDAQGLRHSLLVHVHGVGQSR